MKTTFDSLANAAYIKLSENPVARTRELSEDVMVDLDEYDIVVGVELLNPASAPCAADIDRLCHVNACHLTSLGNALDTLRGIRVTEGQLTRSTPVRVANRWTQNGNLEPA